MRCSILSILTVHEDWWPTRRKCAVRPEGTYENTTECKSSFVLTWPSYNWCWFGDAKWKPNHKFAEYGHGSNRFHRREVFRGGWRDKFQSEQHMGKAVSSGNIIYCHRFVLWGLRVNVPKGTNFLSIPLHPLSKPWRVHTSRQTWLMF